MSDHAARPKTLARRARVLPLVIALMLPAGCGAGEDAADPAPSLTAAPTATAPSSPADRPSPTADAQVVIPTSAFIELPADMRKVPRRSTPTEQALPKLCGNEFGTGGRQVSASASMTVTYKRPGDPASNVPQGMLHQTIFTFDGTGAVDYLRRVRDAVEACPSYAEAGYTVTVESRPLPGVGDEAILLTRTWPQTSLNGERTGGDASGQIAVIRVGAVATVLDDRGWEGTSGSPDVMDRAVREAVRAVEAWRG
ncbi:hypothetical protein [Micromonospora sp. NPDC051006]|uniref:hypothetical protein n=1 Tax=Micromonospora sp. NPDC051006 TaxID=3364283 RepID=UPI0037BB9519